jgi:hypothetical protein
MTERRVAPRHRAEGGRAFRVEAPDGRALAYAALEDASAGGVRLLANRACAPGPVVLVPLPLHPLAGRRFPFRVVRTGAGGRAVAGPFEPPISDDEAWALAGGG